LGGADLRFLSPQPDTSLHCQTTDTALVHRAVCLFTSQLSLVLVAHTRGGMARLSWPGWLVIRLQTVTYLITNRARRWLTSLMRPTALPTPNSTKFTVYRQSGKQVNQRKSTGWPIKKIRTLNYAVYERPRKIGTIGDIICSRSGSTGTSL